MQEKSDRAVAFAGNAACTPAQRVQSQSGAFSGPTASQRTFNALQAKVDRSPRLADISRFQQLADRSAVTQRRWTGLPVSIAQRSSPTGDQAKRMKIEGVKRSGKAVDVTAQASKVTLLRDKAIQTMHGLITTLENGSTSHFSLFQSALKSLKVLHQGLENASTITAKKQLFTALTAFIDAEKEMYGDFIVPAQQQLFQDDPKAQQPFAKPLRNQFDLLHLQASLINDLLCEAEQSSGTVTVDMGGFIATAQLASKSGEVDDLSPGASDIYLWNVAKHDPGGGGNFMAVLADLAELLAIDSPVFYFHAQPWVVPLYRTLNAVEV